VQMVDVTDNDLKLKTPTMMSITGPSQSGKSEFVYNLIKYREQLFDSSFHRIIYCEPPCVKFSNYVSRLKHEFSNLEYWTGLPGISDLQLDTNYLPCLLIVDDLMTEFLNSRKMVELVTKHVHHNHITLVVMLPKLLCCIKI